MKTETLNVIIAFLAFVFAISAGAIVYLNAPDVAKKDDLARVEEQMVTKEDLAEFEEQMVTKEDLAEVEEHVDMRFEHVDERFEHVDRRFDDLEDDIGYIKERVGGDEGGGATPAKLEDGQPEAKPAKAGDGVVKFEGEHL
ncbi:MAG: hypothetical protein MJE68_04320 [Proteobacteria bacterium]|nr:hypothetical protein [Pseudomonadota bacterium]